MSQYEPHPAAALFPMMDETRYQELRDSIRDNGLRHPVILFDGQLLDGRNRMRACVELGIEPATVEHDGNPWAYAWDCNGQRRDLTADQRYLLWKRVTEGSEEWQAQQEQRKTAANRARSEAAKERPRNDDGTLASGGTISATTGREHVSRDQAAKASGTNKGAVQRMDFLDKERPDLAEQVIAGTLKPTQALREVKRSQVAEKVEALPEGTYRVLYADPPWKYGDERNFSGYDQSAAAGQYPTMSVEELKALDVRSLAADDAVLFCWATFPLLPDALEVVKAWGFKYKTSFVWWKQRPNLGHYHNASAELLLIATRGSCTPDTETRAEQVQAVKRTGKHSEKPEAFRALIDSLYPHGPRLELFRRGEAPEGWAVWGNEAS